MIDRSLKDLEAQFSSCVKPATQCKLSLVIHIYKNECCPNVCSIYLIDGTYLDRI